MIVYKSFKITTELGEASWNGGDDKCASFTIDNNGVLTVRVHTIGSEFPSKVIMTVYSQFVIRYGETVELD